MKSRFIVFLSIPLCCLIILHACIRSCVENKNTYSQYKDFEEISNARFRQENRSYSRNHHDTNAGRQVVRYEEVVGSIYKTKALLRGLLSCLSDKSICPILDK